MPREIPFAMLSCTRSGRGCRYGSLSCAAGGVAPTKLNPERQAKPEKLVWQAIGMQKIKYLMSKAMFYGGLLNVVVKGAPRYRCERDCAPRRPRFESHASSPPGPPLVE
jgi:hypothetical protein